MRMKIFGLKDITIMVAMQAYGPLIMKIDKNGRKVNM